MVALLKNDIEQATNDKFGFADHVKVLRYRLTDRGYIVLTVAVSMSYFTPRGKARLKPVYRYQVYADMIPLKAGGFPVKADAVKCFKEAKIIKDYSEHGGV